LRPDALAEGEQGTQVRRDIEKAFDKSAPEVAAAEEVSYIGQRRWMHDFQKAFAVAAAADASAAVVVVVVVVVEKEDKVAAAAAAAAEDSDGSVAVLDVRAVGRRKIEGAQRFDYQQRLDLDHHYILPVVAHLLAS